MDFDGLREFTNRENKFMIYNGIAITDMEEGRVTAELTISENSLNPNAHLHGGAIFTMADVASGTLARQDGRQYATECADIHFLRGTVGGKVIAVARLIRRGRRTCVTQVEITGEQGALLAVVTTHFSCIGESYQKARG